MAFFATVEFRCPASEAFALLCDPARRPEWQSSLRRVELLDAGPPRNGVRWHDVLVGGIRPRMQVVAWEQDRLWAERGTWHGIGFDLSLRFAEHAGCTQVTAQGSADASGLARPAVWLVDRLGPRAVRRDMARAARIVRGH